MSAMQIIYHPGWIDAGWPGLESEPQPGPKGEPILWLALGLGLAIFGLALGQLTPAPALVALPFAVAGLWAALTVAVLEIGGYHHDQNT